MMNVLALGLLLTSLVTSSFLSPNPEKHYPNKEDVIVKEGHRRVVVEYEKGDGNTKVFISPHVADNENGYVLHGAEKVSEKMEHAKEEVDETVRGFSPRELVCDAYGKCKHKIASVIGKGKEHVEDLSEKSEDVVVGKVKDSVNKVSDKSHETKEIVKDVSSKTKDNIAEKYDFVKGKASDAIDSTEKLKEGMENEGRRKMEGVKEMVREKVEKAEEMVEDASNGVKQGASEVKKEAKRELSVILRHVREVLYDVFRYVRDSVSGVLHLMGFSAAYGMCLWITFASSYVLAGALPRNQFAMVQSKIYPVYFKAMAYSLGLALLGHLLGSKRFSLFNAGMFQGLNLLASLTMVLVNMMYLEPRATKVLFERIKKEKEEGLSVESHLTDSSTGVRVVDSPLGETAGRVTTASHDKAKEAEMTKSEILRLSDILKRLNSYSSFLNVLTLMSLTGHLVHLGQRMHIAC